MTQPVLAKIADIPLASRSAARPPGGENKKMSLSQVKELKRNRARERPSSHPRADPTCDVGLLPGVKPGVLDFSRKQVHVTTRLFSLLPPMFIVHAHDVRGCGTRKAPSPGGYVISPSDLPKGEGTDTIYKLERRKVWKDCICMSRAQLLASTPHYKSHFSHQKKKVCCTEKRRMFM